MLRNPKPAGLQAGRAVGPGALMEMILANRILDSQEYSRHLVE
jgi:hypothetical protein